MKWGFSMAVNVKVEELKASILEYVDNKDKPNIHALLEELERQIEDGNWWGDTFLGVDIKTRKGENNLGKLIMKIRSNLYAKSFDDIVEIPLIGERKATSGLENCSLWLN